MRTRALRGTLVLLLTASGCSGDPHPSSPRPPSNVEVQGVRVIPQSLVLVGPGATWRLTAIVAPLDAAERSVIWESTDSTVAAVDAGGLVTARSPGGGVYITAYTRDRSHQASVLVTVVP